MTKLHELYEAGQAIWLDYIRRSLMTSGQLRELIDEGLVGMTSNPTIFDKAIAGSPDYDTDIEKLTRANITTREIYETLAIQDIQMAADILLPVYEKTEKKDGYVSLEVSPKLAHDTEGTIQEARRLFTIVNRSNLMIKVPATKAGIPAIETLIGEGININVTLIFSLKHYEAVANAYIRGLQKLSASQSDLSNIASVASFFISRVDAKIDKQLESLGNQSLSGKIAIANAKMAYLKAEGIFSGDNWAALEAKGAQKQRLLWASTGTKNPSFPDTLYIDELIGPDTVNTVPPATLDAFIDHGTVKPALTIGLDKVKEQLLLLESTGIDLNQIGQDLQDAGVKSFTQSFESLLNSIEKKQDQIKNKQSKIRYDLSQYESQVNTALDEMATENVIRRIWAHDHTVWKESPDEITNRLGWLHSVDWISEELEEIQKIVKQVQTDGYTTAILLGMGGSSLAPEVFQKTFGTKEGYLNLQVLDSTDPGSVLTIQNKIDPQKTLFIVSTKSGGTIETFSFFKYFFNWMQNQVGQDVGKHFIAITDPNSQLETVAKELSFRKIFLNDSNIGGRFSVLSFFGLIPAALIGVDLEKLIDRTQQAICNSEPCLNPKENRGARLGAIMGELSEHGRDKITFVMSKEIASFGDWVEQLIAESIGKDGKGILPVVGEELSAPDVYGPDRIFVNLRLKGDTQFDDSLKALKEDNHPVITFTLEDIYDLGEQFFIWEMATAVAAHRLEINAFDQPNVESTKVKTSKMVTAFKKEGVLPEVEATLPSKQNVRDFLSRKKPGDYICIQAFLEPDPAQYELIRIWANQLRDETHLPVTFGFGPRFLHSTGQLHKGDAGNGLFIQLISQSAEDLPIPDEPAKSESSLTFQTLIHAQSAGDYQALLDENRRILRVDLGEYPFDGIRKMMV